MYIQWCVKGIAGRSQSNSNGIAKQDAFNLVSKGRGITSNWWRGKQAISPHEIQAVLNSRNLDRHLHDYTNYGSSSPFISLAAGCVERDALIQRNVAYSAIDTALLFATDSWAHPGALFYCWIQVGLNPAVEVSTVAEAVRDLNVYHRWSPYQPEGEITAKVHIPANQISRVEWWDPSKDKKRAVDTYPNLNFVDPTPITNLRDLF
jgi:hypothetical protein